MLPEISVIVPVFNVSKYLHQCLFSITSQTFRNIEIIVVNDGSTDDSGAIIDEFLKIDNRIKALHQENKGYGSAVNTGINIATGEYISIIEPDDWIETNMFQVLLEGKKSSGCNIIKCSFNKIYPNNESHSIPFHFLHGESQSIVKPADNIELMLFESSIWCAIYNRKFLIDNGIMMLETPGASYQDVVWKFMTYAVVNDVLLINSALYNYRCFVIGSSSRRKDNFEIFFYNYYKIREFLLNKKQFDRLKNAFFLHQMFDFVFHLDRLSLRGAKLFSQRARIILIDADNNQVSLGNIRFSSSLQCYITDVVAPACRAIKDDKHFIAYILLRRLINIKHSNSLARLLFITYKKFRSFGT